MPKPSTLLPWATSALGISRTSAPPNQKLLDGWEVGEHPPAQWWNSRWNILGTWVAWLDAFESTAHVWTAAQTFNSTLTVGADTYIDGNLNVIGAGHLFAVAGSISTDTNLTVDGDAEILNGSLYMHNNPAPSAGQSNKLTASNLCKSWGAFTGGSLGTVEGFNVSSVAAVAAASSDNTSAPAAVIRVAFATPMANADYSVNVTIANVTGNVVFVPIVTAKSTTRFEFTAWSLTSGNAVAADVSGAQISFTVFGKQ